MNIAIIGPGSIGLLLASKIAQKQENVVLICKTKQSAEIIKSQGVVLMVNKKQFNVSLNATTKLYALKTADFLILAVKAYDLESLLTKIKSYVKKDKKIVLLQNGLDIHKIGYKFFPKHQVIRAILTLGAEKKSVNSVMYTGIGEIIIHNPINDEKTLHLKKILEYSAFNVKTKKNILALEWHKAIINSAINPLGALTKRRNGALLTNSHLKNMLIEVAKEGKTVAEAVGITFDSDPVEDTLKVAQKTANNKSSMLQDLERGKRTEIDFINGKIIEYGKAHMVNVKLNEILYALIKSKEEEITKRSK